ncbi:MAG: DUF2071 domain-containing protein [Candidatus Microthrix sp.]|uniref:DUF2071 domain-containing protein n=1 Tax=Candidatus Neomicrothrix subdominans TaxID=2954438 RepID=A0A936NDM6_9ACTN|nr:DUF2071 domain-containing protein [Candidatus Microthrix subdominans]
MVGDFTEINVRTYVTDALGRRGVWFFSLDVPRSPIVAVARSLRVAVLLGEDARTSVTPTASATR